MEKATDKAAVGELDHGAHRRRGDGGGQAGRGRAARVELVERGGRVVIGVVACSKSKGSAPAPAGEIYTGRTFRAAGDLLRRMLFSAIKRGLAVFAEVAP
jgi:hypothetical protein